MQYQIINKPHVPIVWLDTHAISQVALALYKPTEEPSNAYRRRLYKQLVELRKAGKIFSFESDQLTEIEIRPELVKKATDVLTHTSQGIHTYYRHPERMQFQIAIKAHIEQNELPEIEWRTAFIGGDPMREQSVGRFFVRAHFEPKPEEIADRKRVNNAIADEWEKLRTELVKQKIPENRRRELQFQNELLAGQRVFIEILAKLAAQQKSGIAPTDDEFWAALEVVGTPATLWKNYGGKDGTKGIIQFYGSDHYKSIPYVAISSEMSAHKIVSGEIIKPSDVMDVHNISAFLPYCTVMVLDRAMIHIVKTLKLDERYGVKVITLAQLGSELEGL